MAQHAMEAHVISFLQEIPSHNPHPESSCWLLTVFWDSQWPILQHYMERGNKCILLWNAEKGPEVGYLHKAEGKVVTVCFVTPQCMPSYSTPHHQCHSKTELASSWAPCPQPRPNSFWFPSVWTPQERCKRSSICGRWWDERSGAWLLCNQLKNFFSRGIKKFADCWYKCVKKKEITLKSNVL